MNRILVLDDNQKILDTLSRNFNSEGIECKTALTIAEAINRLHSCPIDLALVDINLGEENGLDAIIQIKELIPYMPILVITGFATVETAVKAIKLGAEEYIKKPVKFSELLKLVKSFLGDKSREIPAIPNLHTRNPNMINMVKKALKLAQSNLSVLISGESGTGKEVIADLIHKYSQRADKIFLRINCAAFPDSLLDNELFGHEKGAYTGAETIFQGVFERANKGTLLFDELGDMPLSIQAKILRAIQSNEIRRIGGKELINIDVRFIGATNQNLERMVEEGRFRRDLYYRLKCASLTLPALRDRKEDILLLTEFFLNEFTRQENLRPISLAAETMDLLLIYDWPGNVRELKSAITYGATICNNSIIKPDDLPIAPVGKPEEKNTLAPGEALERALFLKVLTKNNYNKKKTAEKLNISRTTLYKKMYKYGIFEDK